MEWRIRESGNGVLAEYGAKVDGNVPSPIGAGYIMPCFLTYYISRFETEKQAKQYIKRHPNPLRDR